MRAYIGLGSNLADPIKQVNEAIQALDNLPTTQVISASSLYASPPMGPQDQPDYINAVAEIETQLAPHVLLDGLQAIEQQQGRVRKRHWGERTIDLDLLIYGEQVISDERLNVPHIGIAQRAFVLYPLNEIAPSLMVPKLGMVGELAEKCAPEGIRQLETSQS
jgi:2-amino-4-hydroxy-6-hydroxymethyldihydropteridine diphosphokinase